ncbi:hypothetical protein M422DRAFT_268932 [Sphaerobolus stellatus SS14]|uniref:Uncharacterized protein n=1 Tax=Sphaerobolus stellatus (strain SS14) TaxID=990650 RepID=A0A0C9U5M1_SPHS4|nr:hypothetical protein M422DRAFT_268932 [Sphaerobolus stellatus SS14]
MSEGPAPMPVDETPTCDPVLDRLFNVEGDLQVQAQRIAAVQGSISNIEKLLGKLYEAQGLEKPASISSVGGSVSRVRPAALPDFNGSCDKGQAFLNGCLFYFYAVSQQFPDKQARINWALTYFKSGRAATYANRILRTLPRCRFAGAVTVRG